MKCLRLTILTLLALATAGGGYLHFTGWFEDPQVALRELEKLGIPPTEEQAFAAIGRDDAVALSILSRAGVSMRATDASGNTPMHVATRDARWVTATALLEEDIDFNTLNGDDRSALQTSIEANNIALASAMLQRGAKPDTQFDSGLPALIDAVNRRDLPTARLLLSYKADPDIANEANETALYLALKSAQPKFVLELLKSGASTNAKTPSDQPLLNFLCENWQSCGFSDAAAGALLDQFLEYGADVEAMDPGGKHPLRHSLETKFTSGAHSLLKRVDNVSDTLWVALPQGDEPVIKTLVKMGADVNQPREDGELPLHYLIREKNAGMVRFLIDHNANMTAPGKEGQPAIPLAMALRDEPTILTLIDHEKAPPVDTYLNHPVTPEFRGLFTSALLDFYLRNTHNITPLMCAVCMDQEKVLLKLIEKGANRFAPTAPRKVYPIQLAAKRKNVRIQQILIGVPHEDSEQERHFVINLSKQRVTLYKNGEKLRTGSISSGRRSHPTIPGSYVITDKSRMHRSNLYNNAKMPYFQRFSCTAMGFHTGALPGYPASHGCVRLSNTTAKLFFKESKVGDRVTIEK